MISHFIRLLIVSTLLISCASCRPSLREMEVCLLNNKPSGTVTCSKGQTNYQLPYDQLTGYYAFDIQAMYLLGTRKQECIQSGHLPPTHDTLRELNAHIVPNELPNEIVAVSPVTWGKLQAFFEYCGEHPNGFDN